MKQVPLKQGETMLYAVAQKKQDGALTLLTWKKDREVTVKKTGETIEMTEDGYVHATSTYTAPHDLKGPLREACRREFPRSNRVYVATPGMD